MKQKTEHASDRPEEGPLAQVVDALARMVADADGPLLPSAKYIANRLGVSSYLVSKAARVLRERGVVQFGRGQKIRIPGRQRSDIEPARTTSAEQVASAFRTRIENSELRVGEHLPKVASVSFDMHTSNTTVLKAYQRLFDERLVHRVGKSWVVGAQPVAVTVGAGPRPVMLLLQYRELAWLHLSRSSTMHRFCFQFGAEVERFGIRMAAAFAAPERATYGSNLVGRDQVRDFIRSLGTRYLGALIMGSPRNIPNLRDWLADLTAFDRPAVWFDQTGDDGLAPRSRQVARCVFWEKAGVEAALAHLHDAGHSNVIHAITQPWAQDWQFHRRELLEECAGTLGMNIIGVAQPDIPESKASAGIDEQDSMRVRTLRYTPMFREVFEHPEATALLASRDFSAYYFHHWLALAGVKIPDQMSLLSFDNYVEIQAMPISSVDFGCGYLGYAAFHFLFGDTPVRRDRHGDILSRPAVVDRGSVGPPRSGGLSVDFSFR